MKRRQFLTATAGALGALSLPTVASQRKLHAGSPIVSISHHKRNINYHLRGLEKDFKVMFLADCHITLEDERGRDYYQYAKRMGGAAAEESHYGRSNGRDKDLIASLQRAKKEAVDLVILGGDIINYPALASVELIVRIMEESQIPWAFVAGNHDWHYEGMEGTSDQLRQIWIEKNLLPLYQGSNPLYSSRVINGVNFVLIDDSTYEINGEQLHFFKKELEKEEPIVLAMHIPLYVLGRSVGDYGCAHPDWNAAHDGLYQLERREQWRAEGHTETTYQFRDLVFQSPRVIGVLGGHTHAEAVDFYQGKVQGVAGANFHGDELLLRFIPSN